MEGDKRQTKYTGGEKGRKKAVTGEMISLDTVTTLLPFVVVAQRVSLAKHKCNLGKGEKSYVPSGVGQISHT